MIPVINRRLLSILAVLIVTVSSAFAQTAPAKKSPEPKATTPQTGAKAKAGKPTVAEAEKWMARYGSDAR